MLCITYYSYAPPWEVFILYNGTGIAQHQCTRPQHSYNYGAQVMAYIFCTVIEIYAIGRLRLVDGPVTNAGRVEVRINGVWGTVSGYYWDNNNARVVCRQLGYNVNTGEGEFIFVEKLII